MINIKVDSRKIQKGDIFIALRGIDNDGHKYIDKAILNGASKLIVEEDNNYSIPYEVVPDTRLYLINYLSDNYNKYLSTMTIVGITGTNGKTTSSFLLHNALNDIGYKASYIGTVGYYCKDKIYDLPNTTPDILELYNMFMDSYERGVKYIVMEVSSQGLSHHRVEGFLFDYVAFTNLTQDHLDYHKTMENYAFAKQKLFKKLKKGGKAIINFDDPYKNYYLLEENDNITYGFIGGDYHIVNYKMNHIETVFEYKHNDSYNFIKTPLLGKYNVYNLLLVIALLSEMNISNDMIRKVLFNIKAPAGRMEQVQYKNNSIIIDYAHTPDAIKKIISTVKEVTSGNIYVVFGCTGDRDRTKRPIMLELVAKECQYAIITNDDPHNEDPKHIVNDIIKNSKYNNYEVCLDRKLAIIKGINLLEDNDCLLILGKGHEEFMIIKDKKIPFNDKKIVDEYMESIIIN